jgi:pyrroline-5-carboxylate reductase
VVLFAKNGYTNPMVETNNRRAQSAFCAASRAGESSRYAINPKKIGIIGVGGIASAIVTGFCSKKTENEFFLSPRNAEKAAALAAEFSQVKVCGSNQEVIDNAEWILMSLVKKDFGALKELKFRKDHKVINIAAEMKLTDLKEMVGEAEVLSHVIPLPFIRMGIGPIVVHPTNTETGSLFAPIGDVVYANSMSEVHTFQIVTSIMSSYYALLNEIVKFSDEHGVEHNTSVRFLGSMFHALCTRAASIPDVDLVELANDMTPGGYNEQAMNELLDNGAIAAWRTALDRLMARLKASK